MFGRGRVEMFGKRVWNHVGQGSWTVHCEDRWGKLFLSRQTKGLDTPTHLKLSPQKTILAFLTFANIIHVNITIYFYVSECFVGLCICAAWWCSTEVRSTH